MAKPRQADRVVEVAYAIAMVVNVIVSVSGYLMYGTGVSDEVCPPIHEVADEKVSRDLAKTPGFSPTLNWVAVLLVALNPLTKLPLSLRPVCHRP
jgi:vesicular inhibitory amino acid transporter